MKKNFIFVFILIIFSFLFVGLLYIKKPNEKNGFNRVLKMVKLKKSKTLELPTSYFYFSEAKNSYLYIKNNSENKQLFTLDYDFANLKELDLRINGDTTFTNQKINFGITDSTIFITNRLGNLSILQRKSGHKFNFPNTGIKFDQSFLLSETSLAVRQTILKGNELRRNLSKFDLKKNEIENSYLLEKQIDGFFCTDGLLKLDKESSKLFYLFIYRGVFLCLDTNLKLLYKAKTIDTVSTAKMEITQRKKTIDNNKNIVFTTQTKPPKQISRNCTIYKDKIYILSMLKADNENEINFNRNQVIDVYNIENGKYLYSFYLPKYKRLKPREIKIDNNYLFAIYDKTLVKFIIDV